ncbi:MAG TPA: hypothetical protein PLR20_04690 [Syntrophales bacterium]|nr:hypothetical protein [Syntrophales bacterium]HPI56332.1 hypothetical protein [Syntrophales bacterium]HPN24280.1 hypothetical protein [Syntrophales bacterium]HQM28633.1 hypothetical protein [Syntrophales bacterium]
MPVFSRVAVRVNALDMPEPRKVHPVPIPRCGGMAMGLAALGPIFLWVPMEREVIALLAGGAILFAAGMYDDFKGLGYRAKFMAQVAAALVLVLYGGVVIEDVGNLLPGDMDFPGWLATIVTVFVVVGVTNAINLADGLDGLAGGISLLIFLFISFLAYQVENKTVAIIALSMAGTLFGFLRFNTFPASLFMGDTGSMLLGFSAAALSIMLTQGSPLSPVLPLILLGFPVLDTLSVMALRISEGRSPFSADKQHFHHRLLRLGFYHTEAVFTIYVIQVLLILFAWFFRFYSEWFLLLSYGIFATLVLWLFTTADRTGWKLWRFDLVDQVIKGRLRKLRSTRVAIRFSFRVVYFGLTAFVIFLAFLPASVPLYLSILPSIIVVFLILVWFYRKEWLSRVFMPCLYIFIPLLVYAGELGTAHWFDPQVAKLHNLFYIVLAFFAVATLKFTGRKGGFRMTPMDFIVIVLVLAVLILPREMIPGEAVKRVIPKILALFFGYEVLFGELRGNISALVGITIVMLLIVSVRGIL